MGVACYILTSFIACFELERDIFYVLQIISSLSPKLLMPLLFSFPHVLYAVCIAAFKRVLTRLVKFMYFDILLPPLRLGS